VLATGKLLDLDRPQMAQALALALVPNMALNQTRQGELSAWKGCAAADASRNALFAVLLAQAGLTGAEAPFEANTGSGMRWAVSNGHCRSVCRHTGSRGLT
jgi:2-methylcitrate dehydratase